MKEIKMPYDEYDGLIKEIESLKQQIKDTVDNSFFMCRDVYLNHKLYAVNEETAIQIRNEALYKEIDRAISIYKEEIKINQKLNEEILSLKDEITLLKSKPKKWWQIF